MRKILCSLLPLLAFAKINLAQTPCPNYPAATEQMHVNRLRLPMLRPAARLGNLTDDAGAVFHDYDGKPQPTAGIYTSGLWVGGMDEAGKIRVAAETYRFNSASLKNYKHAAGPQSAADCQQWDRFWAASKIQIERHRADFADGSLDQPQPEIMAWPAVGNPFFKSLHGFDLPTDGSPLAPFFDHDADGKYDPTRGDFPHPTGVDTSLHVSKIVWNLFHDSPKFYADSLGGLGFDFGWTVWATACADSSVLNDAVFFNLEIKNSSAQSFDSVQVAIWSDGFMGGEYKDDYFGTNVAANSYFFYNSREIDSPYFPHVQPPFFEKRPPVAAWTGLNRPLDHSNYYIQNSACDPIFAMIPPSDLQGYFSVLQGRWRDGSPVVAKNVGYNFPIVDSSLITKYIFTGHPADSNGWHLFNNYLICPSEAMHLFSFKLGKMLPGQTENIEYAYSVHRDTAQNLFGNLDLMFSKIEQMRQLHSQKFKNACLPAAHCQPFDHPDCVWAGDANHDGRVNHCDILPIGLKLATAGSQRAGATVWEPQPAADWGNVFDQKFDLKHADCNGDGRLDTADLNVAKDFFGFQKPDFAPPADVFSEGKEIFLIINNPTAKPENVQTDDLMILRTGLADLPELRGLAYEMEFDTNYWRFVLPNDPPFVFKKDSTQFQISGKKANGLFQANVRAAGNVNFAFARLNLRAKAISLDSPKLTFVKLKNIKAFRADGSEIKIGSWHRQFCFGGGCATSAGEAGGFSSFKIYPNPSFDGQVVVESDESQVEQIRVFDASGRQLHSQFFAEKSKRQSLDLSVLPAGFYFLKIWDGQREQVSKLSLLPQP